MEHKIAILCLLVLVIQLSYTGVDSAALARPCRPQKCNIRCRYGSVIDSNGCLTCFCKPSPRPGPTPRPRPIPRPRPPTCGPVCLIYCPNGNVLDKRGCPTCRCKPDRILY
ncbi:hypothetical protein BsWGS_11932 [Bradybaena similaris]